MTTEMSFEEKCAALASLGGGGFALQYNADGVNAQGWWVSIPKVDALAITENTPEQAITQAWEAYSTVPLRVGTQKRCRYVRWTGFMWSDCPKPAPEEPKP